MMVDDDDGGGGGADDACGPNSCHDGDGGFDDGGCADGCADHSNEDDLQFTYNEGRTPKRISQFRVMVTMYLEERISLSIS